MTNYIISLVNRLNINLRESFGGKCVVNAVQVGRKAKGSIDRRGSPFEVFSKYSMKKIFCILLFIIEDIHGASQNSLLLFMPLTLR